MKWGFPLGVSFLFWGFIGLLRLLEESIIGRYKDRFKIAQAEERSYQEKIQKVAVCLPAHNEGVVIKGAIRAITALVPPTQCFVVSDGSTDRTALLARETGGNVLELYRAHGKALALEKLMRKFSILKRFDYVLIVDADTRVNRNYLKKALPLFDNPKIVAIAGYAKSRWRNDYRVGMRYFIAAYRSRLYRILQIFLSFGQSWRFLNVLPVIPGFASIYRSSILKKIKMFVPGLAIEDYNLTFQIKKKGLGLVAHHPEIFATAQDPTNLTDYVKQVRRWNLGFFQTVLRYGIWPSWFWVANGLFTLEALAAAVVFLFLTVAILILVSPLEVSSLPPWLNFTSPFLFFLQDNAYEIWVSFLFLFTMDYLLTLYVATRDEKPMLLVYGLGFILLRILDAAILLVTIPTVPFVRSRGVWKSPGR